MSKSEMKCRGLQSDFLEASKHFAYGKAIMKAKSAMVSHGCDPCQGKTELMLLIQQLNMIRDKTSKDWCYEGYCLGIFTPNRGRIDRYLDAYKEELKIHTEDCKQYSKIVSEQKKSQKIKDFRDDRKSIITMKQDHELKLKQLETASRETIRLAELKSEEKIKERALVSLEKFPQPDVQSNSSQIEGVKSYIKNIWSKPTGAKGTGSSSDNDGSK